MTKKESQPSPKINAVLHNPFKINPVLSWIKIEIYRPIRFFFQRLVRGFDDSITWNLDNSVVEFILPRLKRFRKIVCDDFPAYPSELNSHEEWMNILDDIIYSLELRKKSVDIHYNINYHKDERYRRGIKYLFKYFDSLWW